ncbi:hypothetical protein CWN94_11660 [Vibrio splendidus]|uniref:helicase HerA domain-containing protein n=1 Tax=Vibrio TaxID=662 RepID=UPI000C84FB8D|nr:MULTISPECIES: DUF87 domain-containing protein [Vibrio]CAK1845868.1 DUF87 domain-containing protein [Vibrio crassostreae]MCC4786652.1 DUF87 domain-containing protein [Vibrio splendidus]PMH28439.1 hypothetical protein BCU71_07705 [Vibrio lentus]PMK70420.1 hypothetical protein BCT93_07340 [Vibrio lentus]PTO54053.1 hypothetical protein CWN94_11660 [Vibrio splendidus]
MTKVNTALDCEHQYVIGASGSGKSYYVKRIVERFKRVIIWDPDGEYGDISGIVTASTTSNLIEAIEGGDAVVRFVPRSMDTKILEKCFEFVSLAAFCYGNCLFVAEEIADVTTPSKALNGWGTVLRRGRKRGVTVIAVSQRPAEADKTVFTQARIIRTGRLDGEGDIQRVASNMRIPSDLVGQLGKLEFFELDRNSGQLKAGKMDKSVILRKDWNSQLDVTALTKAK